MLYVPLDITCNVFNTGFRIVYAMLSVTGIVRQRIRYILIVLQASRSSAMKLKVKLHRGTFPARQRQRNKMQIEIEIFKPKVSTSRRYFLQILLLIT